jgi:hypothetical protein
MANGKQRNRYGVNDYMFTLHCLALLWETLHLSIALISQLIC